MRNKTRRVGREQNNGEPGSICMRWPPPALFPSAPRRRHSTERSGHPCSGCNVNRAPSCGPGRQQTLIYKRIRCTAEYTGQPRRRAPAAVNFQTRAPAAVNCQIPRPVGGSDALRSWRRCPGRTPAAGSCCSGGRGAGGQERPAGSAHAIGAAPSSPFNSTPLPASAGQQQASCQAAAPTCAAPAR